jgi:hypothetical protein
MAVSVYFNNQGATREQILIEDMIIESIRNHGIDVYYLPRESHSELDRLFGDDPVKKYTKAYKIDMYLESFQDFEGNQEFFSKFGLQIQKEARVAVARRTFERFVPSILRNVPKEGDLIFLPVQQKLLEIRFVEEEKNFFQAGKFAPYMYGLNLEVFKYNGEIIDTGVAELDAIADLSAYGIEFTLNAGGSGTYDDHEIVYQGATLAAATAKGYVSSWDLPNRKLIIRNIKGSFAANTVIKGSESNAQWTMTSGDSQENATDDFEENVLLENEADNILDWTETNPFGTSDEN